MLIAAIILGLFAYGGYKRQQRQVATLAEGSMPHNVAPATAAGAEIAKDVPSGNVPNSPQPAQSTTGALLPPGDLQSAQVGHIPNGGQVFVRQATNSRTACRRVRCLNPASRRPRSADCIAAYEREQQAIAAPTTLARRIRIASPGKRSRRAAGIATMAMMPPRSRRWFRD